MPGLSSAGETTVLAALTTTAYVSLHTADPGDIGASEVAGNGYARQGPIAFTDSGANPTQAANSAILTFPVATGTWGNIQFFGLWTAATSGAFQGSGAVIPAKAVNSGDQARFQTGSLTVTAQ